MDGWGPCHVSGQLLENCAHMNPIMVVINLDKDAVTVKQQKGKTYHDGNIQLLANRHQVVKIVAHLFSPSIEEGKGRQWDAYLIIFEHQPGFDLWTEPRFIIGPETCQGSHLVPINPL